MSLSFQLVSNVNVYNLTFVSIKDTLKEIKEHQVSKYQEKVLCESIKMSLKKNHQKLKEKIKFARTVMHHLEDDIDRQMTEELLDLVDPYENYLNRLQDVLAQQIDGNTYEKCLPIFKDMEEQMRHLILTLQKDLKITTNYKI